MRAVFAHGEDDKAAVLSRDLRDREAHISRARGPAQEKADGKAHEQIGGFAEPACDLVHGPNIAEVGECDQEGDFRSCLAAGCS